MREKNDLGAQGNGSLHKNMKKRQSEGKRGNAAKTGTPGGRYSDGAGIGIPDRRCSGAAESRTPGGRCSGAAGTGTPDGRRSDAAERGTPGGRYSDGAGIGIPDGRRSDAAGFRKSEGRHSDVPMCPVQKKCGGCQFQGIPYAQQLKIKQRQVEKLLKPFGKVNPIIGMENPYYYRNKVHAVFGRTRNGEVISGTYQENTHKIIPVEQCLIEDQKSAEIIRSIRGLLKSFKIRTYDEDTGYGLLRHVLVRRGFQSGQIMVVLVLASPILPSKNNFVAALRRLHPDITTIILNINDKKTSMVLGEKEKVLYGSGYIEDTLLGKTFRISAKSFYQVNPVQTEILYRTAIDYAHLTGKERVLDAYCGIGTIGLIAAAEVKEVIGVELNCDAVRDARINAKRNAVTNAQFYNADAGKFMTDLAEQNVSVDVVFMDPPRAGSDEAFLSSVVKLQPEKVVYISCNPETLARDLKYLTGNGYRVEKIQPIDMFCFTEHVETVCCLSRIK